MKSINYDTGNNRLLAPFLNNPPPPQKNVVSKKKSYD